MPSYEAVVSQRAMRLEGTSLDVDTDTKSIRDALERSRDRTERELKIVADEVLRLHEQTTASMARVSQMVERFQTVVKKKELERLQRRVDAWAPEQKITREMFRRFLEDP